jgi:hypothetical protein
MLPSKEWKPVDVCICGASAGLLCGSGCGLYAWFKAVPFTTIRWLAFVSVTAVAGAILSLAGLQLWNWIGRGPRRTRRKGGRPHGGIEEDRGVPREALGGPDGQQQGMSRENCRLW